MNKNEKKSVVLLHIYFVILGIWMMLSIALCQMTETDNDEKQSQTIHYLALFRGYL